MLRPIAISLSPNTQAEDVFAALKMFFNIQNILDGKSIILLEEWFKKFYKLPFAISFASGRGALYAILRNLSLKKGDEVILQAFTCVAVCGPIIALGAKPVYVDINESLTLDTFDLEKKITQNTKAIIVQHTFGIPANITEIIRIAKKHKITVIEDCAHVIGDEFEGKKLGSFGDAAFFSFGRDKAFSSVFGGMVISGNEILGKKLKAFQRELETPSFFWTLQQVFHPIAFSFILPLYNFLSIGKLLIVIFQKLNFLSFPVLKEEKDGILPGKYIKKIPNALAFLSLIQLKKIDLYNDKRKEIAWFYINNLDPKILPYKKRISFLRFPVLINNRDNILKKFVKEGIYLGKWYSEIIDPKGVNFARVFYKKGSCSKAEEISKKIINFPTYPVMSVKQAKKVLEVFQRYA